MGGMDPAMCAILNLEMSRSCPGFILAFGASLADQRALRGHTAGVTPGSIGATACPCATGHLPPAALWTAVSRALHGHDAALRSTTRFQHISMPRHKPIGFRGDR